MILKAKVDYLHKNTPKLLFLNSSEDMKFIQSFESKKDNLVKEIERLITCSENKNFKCWEFVASDNKIAKLKGNTSYLNKEKSYNLEIMKIKSQQINHSIPFSIDKLSKEPSCKKSFKLKIVTRDRELKVNMNIIPNECYESILKRIVREINNSGLGLYAKMIVKENKKGISKVIRVNGEYGLGNDFKISIYGNEDFKNLFLVDALCNASDTVYELDGKVSSTLEDYIKISPDMYAIPLKVGKVTFENKIVLKAVISDVKKIITLYNDLLELLIKNRNSKLVSREQMRANTLTSDIIFTLSQIGIEIAVSGKIICSNAKLTTALKADYDGVIEVLCGQDGLFDRIIYMLKTTPIRNENLLIKNPKGVVVVNFNDINSKKIGG